MQVEKLSDNVSTCLQGLADRKVSNLTLGDHFAKHRHGLQSGAVPSAVAKLELTLVYGQLGSTAHGIHHLHTALTDLNLEREDTGATSAENTMHVTPTKYYLIQRVDVDK